mgnify:CR=1 FL=1
MIQRLTPPQDRQSRMMYDALALGGVVVAAAGPDLEWWSRIGVFLIVGGVTLGSASFAALINSLWG